MKFMSLAVCFAPAFLLAGCFNTTAVRYPIDQVIWTPRTDLGRTFRERNEADLRSIVSEVQQSPQLSGTASFVKDGLILLLRRNEAGDSTPFLGLHLVLEGGCFNTLRTTYQSRAASAYSRVLYPIAVILARHQQVLSEYQPGGVYLWLDWKVVDASVDPYGLYPRAEGMSAWIPDSTLVKFASSDITIQDLARQSKFTSSQGRTELDFTNTH